jgi:hypothetical protein
VYAAELRGLHQGTAISWRMGFWQAVQQQQEEEGEEEEQE